SRIGRRLLSFFFELDGFRGRLRCVMADRTTDLQIHAEKGMKVRRDSYWHILGVWLLLGTALVGSKLSAHRRSDSLAVPLEKSISREIDGAIASDNPPLTAGTMAQLKASSYLSRTYVKRGMRADLFIAYYAQQRAGESMHSPKHCLPGAGWEIWD